MVPRLSLQSILDAVGTPADTSEDGPERPDTETPDESSLPDGSTSIESDGGTQMASVPNDPAGPVEEDLPDVEIVLQEDPDQLYDTSGSAQRVIDENLNVVKQNRVMTEWTGVDCDRQDLKCMNQMTGAFCGTENCTKRQIMDGDERRVEVEVEKELPNGETRQTLLVSEAITDDHGEVVGITESFKDISHVKAAAEEVSNSIGELSQNADDVASSSDEISSGAQEMTDSMDEVANEISTLSASIEEVASSAEEVAATSDTAQERARDGSETADAAIDEMENIDAAFVDLADDLDNLQGRVDEIDEIVEVINDIADQTNMLALNANIEAAQAGGQGERFAVVADEVKNLAEDAQDNASTIESMIEGIQTDTTETVTSLDQAREQVDAGIDQAEATMSALDEIVEAIEEASRGIEEVAEATDDQAASAEEVASVVDQVADQAERVASETQNIYAANEEQAQMVNNLEEAVEKLEND